MATAKKTATTLLRANLKNDISWRLISKIGYHKDDVIVLPGIAPGTLCRFAKSNGEWKPKNIEIQKLLGIYHYPRFKHISEMSTKELLYALSNRQPMP